MVVMLVVLKDLPQGVTAGFADSFQARRGEQKGHAGFGEFEMIRTVKHAAGGEKIGFDDASLRRRLLIERLVKRGITEGEVNNVLRATEGEEAVHVYVGERPAERVKRLESVMLGAQQPFFFRRCGEEQDGASGRRLHLLVSLSHYQKSGGSSGVVKRAFVNLIACQTLIATQMVPVRRVNHIFVTELRICACA